MANGTDPRKSDGTGMMKMDKNECMGSGVRTTQNAEQGKEEQADNVLDSPRIYHACG